MGKARARYRSPRAFAFSRSREPQRRLIVSLKGFTFSTPSGAAVYVRFTTQLLNSETGRRLGVFWGADQLLHLEQVDQWSRDLIEESIEWFNAHLPAPSGYPIPTRAVFWFRSERQDVVSQVWSLVHALRASDVPVDLLSTRNPGYICYRDDYQVAAISFNGTA